MTEPRALFLEERGGDTVLVGGWPEVAIVDAMLLEEISDPCRELRLGDDFEITLANGRARYRYIEGDRFAMRCLLIRKLR